MVVIFHRNKEIGLKCACVADCWISRPNNDRISIHTSHLSVFESSYRDSIERNYFECPNLILDSPARHYSVGFMLT